MRRITGAVALAAAFTIATAGVSTASPESSGRTYQLPLDCGTDGQLVATVLTTPAVVAWVEGDHFVAKSFDPDVHVTVTVDGETVSFHDDEARDQGARGVANNRDFIVCTFEVADDFVAPLTRNDARRLGLDESLVGEDAHWVANGEVTVQAFQTGQ